MGYDDRCSVAGLLRTQAGTRPEAEMLVFEAGRRSWAQHYARAAEVARGLERDGIAPGDRIAVLDRNGTPYFDFLFGGALMGAVNVALNWRLAPLELAAVIDDSEAPVLVVHPDYGSVVAAMASELRHVRRIVVLGGEEAAGSIEDRRRVAYDDWLADLPASDPGFRGDPSTVSVQLYTSGTTGLPKGVMLTNANLATAISQAGENFGVDETTVSLVAMPLFHIGGSGWALCGMSRGGRSVILRDVDPAELLHLVGKEGVTETFVVPAVLMFCLQSPELATTDLSSLRNVFYGASPISEDVLVRCLETFKCGFTQVYGMTETTGAITALRPEDHDPNGPRRHLLRSAGKPHPGVEIKVVSPATGEPAPPGQVGEILTRSPFNMAGYFKREAETAETVDGDGWLRTGDAGYLDEEGYLFLHDRIKDMIVTGGENVYPAEVENALLAHPAVLDAAVIGVPDDRWGEAVKGLVVFGPGPRPSDEELIAFCHDRLAGYKCPKTVEAREQLPRNPSGKILKRELREPYWQERERRVG